MCGICGIVNVDGGEVSESLLRPVKSMMAALRHRGPDGEGHWVAPEPDTGVAFGHLRLSIIDLSPAGRQPMVSSCERFVLTYNGEIYNADELRGELRQAGRAFRGYSDTEVIVEACAVWGVERTLARLIGMFAFGLWDRKERRLTLARDRLGIKPLYWCLFEGRLVFSSELTSLRLGLGHQPAVSQDALAAYLRFAYVPDPLSILEGVHKLEAGSLLHVDRRGAMTSRRYWDLTEIARDGLAKPYKGSEEKALQELEALIFDAVRRRMVSDVPLGAFLSGGIDSSLVAAMMQKASGDPIKTFTIGFDVPGYDEANFAKQIAGHLGSDHHELYVKPADVLESLPQLHRICDEPFGDSSIVPTFLLSRMSRREVTVALSGDGGDELFAGYNRHLWGRNLDSLRRAVPRRLRRPLANWGLGVSETSWDRFLAPLAGRLLPSRLGEKMHKALPLLALDDPTEAYRSVTTQWEPRSLGLEDPDLSVWDRTAVVPLRDSVERMQLLDMAIYLPSDILTKVDRASMAVSLEARVPLLDHRIVEFSWRLPSRLKLRGQDSKYALKQILARHLPRQLFERPKAGFSLPIAEWLRGPLREWGESGVADPAIESALGLDGTLIRQRWREHLSGQRNWQSQLWTLLSLVEWHKASQSRTASSPAAIEASAR